MELTGHNVFVVVACLLGFLPFNIEALRCYQCNVFIRGTPWPCDSDRGMRTVDDCHACLKTYTRTYLHNTFHDVILAAYESRVCVKDRDYVKEAGCHAQEIASGYMKRCFCFDDLCNSSNIVSSTWTILPLSLILTVLLRRII